MRYIDRSRLDLIVFMTRQDIHGRSKVYNCVRRLRCHLDHDQSVIRRRVKITELICIADSKETEQQQRRNRDNEHRRDVLKKL